MQSVWKNTNYGGTNFLKKPPTKGQVVLETVRNCHVELLEVCRDEDRGGVHRLIQQVLDLLPKNTVTLKPDELATLMAKLRELMGRDYRPYQIKRINYILQERYTSVRRPAT